MGTSKKAIVSGMFWTFSERMAEQLVSVVVTIVLARLLTPDQYGTISLVTVFVTLASVFVTNGFGTALIQKEHADALDFSTVFYFGIVFSLAVCLILYFVAEFIAVFYHMPILTPVLRVLSLQLPFSAINSVQQAYVSRGMNFKNFFFATTIGTFFSAIVGITMAYNGFGVWSLVWQSISNTVGNTVVLWFMVKWRPIWAFSFTRLEQLFSYGWKLLVQGFLITLYDNIRSLAIGKFYSARSLAFYTKGNQYPNLIVTNIDTAMGRVLFPAMSKEQSNFFRIKSVARRSTKLSSFIMSPLLIGFASCAKPIVSFLLTDKWLPIVPYIRIICFCLLVRAAQTATLQAIKATGKSNLVLKMDIPVRIVGFIALMISLKFGVIYVALSDVIVEYFCLILYGVATSRTINYGLREIFWDLWLNVLPALIMGLIVLSVDSFLSGCPVIVVLLLDILLGIFAYVVACVILKNESFFYIFSAIKKERSKRLPKEG
ncbi:lipopolysaccharide biosynthesis protein [Lactiplantibacillus pentosus]|uniref:lipopolysaccharide biosynthesis protein n=1 Tax=Lactiplantibacillus pentosus TaxID=1589 RepID=UPI0020A70B29|nr:lipopolysaccharide biosynthesis protein [Lactiplantibacillus pentosus]